MVRRKATVRRVQLILLGAVIVTACDSAPLVAPIASTISVFSSVRTLTPGGSAEITAIVIEEAGTPVHDGTVVTFTASLGTVNPVEAETRDGVAVTTFTAGSMVGTAQIAATSGGALTGPEAPNVIDITIAN
jgi:hypothetical protein